MILRYIYYIARYNTQASTLATLKPSASMNRRENVVGTVDSVGGGSSCVYVKQRRYDERARGGIKGG